MKKKWIEILTYNVNNTTSYVGQIEDSVENIVQQNDPNSLIKIDNVRWYDEKKKKVVKYSEYEEGYEDFVYLKASSILRVSVIRDEKVSFWENA